MHTEEQKAYIKAMEQWGKECAEWQLAHPHKDLITELASFKTNGDTGADHPPPPPPNP